ncbi:MAG: helix-turn-helix transcriptional regulator [Abyssibacter sp.]|nr:helix-turn-helix transcriptional regulator [Abyssibacter sp.]
MSRTTYESFDALFSDVERHPGYWAEQIKLELAYELERLLRRRGLNKTAFATVIGTSPSYITKLLRGNVNCTIENMARLVHALGGRVHLRLADTNEVANWAHLARGSRHQRPSRLAVLSSHQGDQPIFSDWTCANDSESVAA